VAGRIGDPGSALHEQRALGRSLYVTMKMMANSEAMHRTQRNADGFGHRPAGPVGCLVPRLSAGQRNRAAISDCSVEYRPHADSRIWLSTKVEPIPCIDGETYSP
jgi:hypothetical protein